MQDQLMDHLFRHHYGKMVSVLTRIFGLSHLETIEDAVQDTFIQASTSWRKQKPDNPEAWLTKAAKNRVLDLFRQIKSSKERESLVQSSSEAMGLAELFLDAEIEDSQLRMIFTACHPKIFNEGFHSGKQTILVRKELCGEAMRLCQIILKNKTIRTGKAYALFSLMCFHAARLDSKLDVANEIVDLKNRMKNCMRLIPLP